MSSSGHRANSPVKQVEVAVIGGVAVVRRHILDHEAARLGGIAARLGKRLQWRLRQEMQTWMPDADFRETLALYKTIVLDLLKEQRLRAQLAPGKGGATTLTDEEYESELRHLAIEAIRALPAAELQREMLRRGVAIPVVPDDTPG